MEKFTAEQMKSFQHTILTWYDEHHRDLPWRKTRNPYHILVSEVMLQQTQVTRVIPKFEAWIQAFPTVEALAGASTAAVLAHWSGLGYNRRALNLKKTAQIVSNDLHGTFPQTEKALLALPGIGTYTARALLCFAYDKQIAVVDTNVRKVIITQLLNNQPTNEKTITNLAAQLLPHGKAYEWNQALMDYASTVLKKEKLPVPKQSTFHGSHRYYRGQILKVLLARKVVPQEKLGVMIKKNFTETEKKWLQNLLDELVAEGFIVVKKHTVTLAS